uniref:zinc finger protein 711-like n=1 Tax=Bombus vancouverensis nearcticus TaxID=2705178 RepID=UPI001438DE57|nr:zinc finger protein 711-like [Bombus vancouverensis nearcticus]
MVSYLLLTFIGKEIYVYSYIFVIIYISPIPIFSFRDYQPYLVDDWFGDEQNVPREYLQSADFTYVLPDRRRRRPYQRTRISVNRYVEKKKFPCPTCPSVFSHKNNLYYHSKFECGQLPRFNCPYCVYRTKHVSNVRAHVRRKHPGRNVYAIDVCKILGT